ncbi:MAG: hypothetical protein ACTSW1_12615 [Candidatus Hodarchaeales archaeon]
MIFTAKTRTTIWNVHIATKKHRGITCCSGYPRKIIVHTAKGDFNIMDYKSEFPKVITDIIDSVEKFITSQELDRNISKPVKIKKSNNNMIISWNIYFNSMDQFEKNFLFLEKLINRCLTNIQGEIIFYNVSHGTISDHTTKVFQDFSINKAKLWDVYLYKPEIFIYIRLLHESIRQQTNKNWISIDIDVVRKSAWFID